MFRDSDIKIKEFCNFQEIINLRFSVCFDQKCSIFFYFFYFFFFFFTFFGVPIIDSICFSIMNGDSEVIGLSSLLEITKTFAKFSFALNVNVVSCVASSEESNARNRFREAMVINVWFDSNAPHPPWSPTRGRLTEIDLLFLTSTLLLCSVSRSESSARPHV